MFNRLLEVSDPFLTHTAVWNWGDGSTSAGTVTEASGSGNVTGSHSYTAAGVYTITLTVTDDDGGSGQSTSQTVVVYNKIVFSSTRDGNSEIYSMNIDGSEPTRLTSHPAADAFPVWSHDSTRIAFTTNRLLCDVMIPAELSAALRPHGYDVAVSAYLAT